MQQEQIGIGRRKTAVSAVRLRTGTGKINVNGKLSKVGYLFHTFVHPNHRKRNIAKKLLQQMEEELINHSETTKYFLEINISYWYFDIDIVLSYRYVDNPILNKPLISV